MIHATEHFDVLIVGAGISGIGSAYHLQNQCPDKTYVVLEGLESYGGTWWMHRYPGIRSDSDLYTFGYRFKPWMGKPIATADEILRQGIQGISEIITLPGIVNLDGIEFSKVPSRPGCMAEYEEKRGSRRIFVLFQNGRLVYNYDEKRQEHTFRL